MSPPPVYIPWLELVAGPAVGPLEHRDQDVGVAGRGEEPAQAGPHHLLPRELGGVLVLKLHQDHAEVRSSE